MTGIVQTTCTLFLLHTIVLFADGMVLVSVCPKNLQGIKEASNRLGCGNDRNGNNQYLCLPNKEKTSLVELCFNGTMEMVEMENCLEIAGEKLIYHSCSNFSHGCPETHFWSYEFYKYPECQDINIEFSCYVSQPFCPPILHSDEPLENDVIVYTSSILGSLASCVIICIILCLIWRRKHQNTDDRTSDNTSEPPEDDRPSDTTSKSQEDDRASDKLSESPEGDYFPTLEAATSVSRLDGVVTSHPKPKSPPTPPPPPPSNTRVFIKGGSIYFYSRVCPYNVDCAICDALF